jgi:hypothetical protein
MKAKMAANYKKLTEYLKSSELKDNTIRLTFKQIEEIIGDALPNEAREFRTWWSNQKSSDSPQKSGWLDAGFIIIKTKFNEDYVELLKI